MNLKEKHKEDKWWKWYFQSEKFKDVCAKAEQEYKEGKCVICRTHKELQQFLTSL